MTKSEPTEPYRSLRSFSVWPTTQNTFYPRMFGANGAVSSHHYLSALAGRDILRAGGNAVDAAAAATLVEGVVNPQMHTIGGELPILVGTPGSPTVVAINGNMVAPAAATPERFRQLGHSEIPDEGILAAGVPGAFGAIITALRRFGRLSFADVSHAARLAARQGFSAHSGLLRQHKFGLADNLEAFRQKWPATGAIYLSDGDIPLEGQLIRNDALARTYDFLANVENAATGSRDDRLSAVFDAFYKGDVAREIVEYSEANGGLLARSDFDTFSVPIEGTASIEFAGVTVHKCGPWTQGPAMLQSLSILKAVDLVALEHNSAEYVHAVIEAMKLAFADREQYYGDPLQISPPMHSLLSDSYGRARAGLLGARANGEIRPGDPRAGDVLLPIEDRLGGSGWGAGTVHVDAADSEGFLAAFTPSGGWLRSAGVMPALGFPLGSRLSNCYLAPAHHPNIVAPFKRPRTTISPSLVVRDGKPWMAFGSMGGDQQDQWQLQYFLNRIVFDMPIQRAIEAPKFSSEHFPAFFAPHDFFLNRVRVEPSLGEVVIADLRERGHDVDIGPEWSEGYICAVERHEALDVVEAGADPRGSKSEVFPACALAW